MVGVGLKDSSDLAGEDWRNGSPGRGKASPKNWKHKAYHI